MATFLRRNLEGCYVFASPPKAIIKADLSKCHTFTAPSSRHIVRKTCGKIHTKAVRPEPVANFQRQIHTLQQQWEEAAEPLTPPPLAGRLNVPVQTEHYLEELARVLDERDIATQTDPLLEKPPTPLFLPAKSGIDKATQIWEGELFDFEEEVQPVLEVLVAQTMEQALVEVVQEEEMREMLDTQRRYEKVRMAELAERQRQEELDRRLAEERAHRISQHEMALKLEKELQSRVAASLYSRSIFSDILDSLLARLQELGYFNDPAELGVERTFIPWLNSRVSKEMTMVELCRLLIDALLAEALSLDERETRELVKKESSESVLGQDEVLAIRQLVEEMVAQVDNEVEVQKTLEHILEEVDLHDTVRRVLSQILRRVQREVGMRGLEDLSLGEHGMEDEEPLPDEDDPKMGEED